MEGYLGEAPVNVAEHPTYKDWTPLNWALLYIEMYSGFDGSHHKDWLIDQVARILHGTPVLVTEARWENGQREYRFRTDKPSTKYLTWVESMLGDTYEDGSREYSYDVGVAP